MRFAVLTGVLFFVSLTLWAQFPPIVPPGDAVWALDGLDARFLAYVIGSDPAGLDEPEDRGYVLYSFDGASTNLSAKVHLYYENDGIYTVVTATAPVSGSGFGAITVTF